MMSDTTAAALPSFEMRQGRLPRYVAITPARNEAAFIEMTINSMVRQTARPVKWVIVSDGSTDGTDEIVKKYAAVHQWMELIRMPERPERHFAGKADAFNAGYAKVKGLSHDIVVSLDADISFDKDYFSFLMKKFAEDPRLGVGGTPFREDSRQYDYRFTSIEHVSGACQSFRRECFEEIGGYRPIRGGGIDWVAVTTARMIGWGTKTFPERVCIHHRKMGTGASSRLAAKFRVGRQDFYLGGHPLWELFRAIYQMKNSPAIIGGVLILAGYFWAMMAGTEKAVSKELETFRRKEQMRRLAAFFTRK